MNSAQKAKSLLQKQESMNNRMNHEQLSASKQAADMGLSQHDQSVYVEQHIEEYQRTEIIRRSVNDVRRRAKEQEEKRKMRHKAYSGVKSKIAGNMKVIDRTNQGKGYVNPHLVDAKKRPMSSATLNKLKSRSPVKGMGFSQRGANLDNSLYSDIVFQNGGSRTIHNSAQKSHSLNTSDDDLLARFQSQAKTKMNASPYRNMNFTDDKTTNLKVTQPEPRREEVKAAPQMMSQSMTNMTNVKSESQFKQFQSSGNIIDVDVGAELETPIAVKSSYSRVNQSQTIETSEPSYMSRAKSKKDYRGSPDRSIEYSPSPMSRGKKGKKKGKKAAASPEASPERMTDEWKWKHSPKRGKGKKAKKAPSPEPEPDWIEIEEEKRRRGKKNKAPARPHHLEPERSPSPEPSISKAQMEEGEAINERVGSLSKKALIELKSLQNPPQDVMMVLQAFAVLLGRPADLTWPQIKAQILMDFNLIRQIVNYDKDNIPDQTIRKAEAYTQQPSFTFANVVKKSSAAGNVCNWIIAVVEYHKWVTKVRAQMAHNQNTSQVQVEQQQKQRASQVSQVVTTKVVTTSINTSNVVNRQEARTEAVRDDLSGRSQFSQVSLDRAMGGVQSIKQSDITEIKAIRRPKDIVKMVIDAVQILFRQPLIPVTKATMEAAKQEFPFIESSYDKHSGRMLAGPLLQNLLYFATHELDHINDETIELLEPYLNLKDVRNPPQNIFTPEIAKCTSAALWGLVVYIQSISDYHKIQNGINIEPRPPASQPPPARSPVRQRSPIRSGKKKGKKAPAKVNESIEVESIAASSYAGAASTTTPEQCIQNAQKALTSLTMADVVEFASFNNPPAGTELVVRAVQILLGKTGAELTDWRAQRNIMRPPTEFLAKLRGYDVSRMQPNTIKKLKTPELLGNPIFCPEVMCKKSKAAAGLASWVINTVIYVDHYADKLNQRSSMSSINTSPVRQSATGFTKSVVTQDVSQVEERKVVKSAPPARAAANHNVSDRPKPIIRAAGQKSLQALTQLKLKSDQMERFVKRTIEAGQPWTDPDFKPARSSLYDPRIDDEIDRGMYDSFTWRRASEIYNPAYIFEDGIEPNDINQGQLGDCYFLAALSSLAEFPEDVEQMFVTKEINAAGIYLVRFILNGQETPVIVDDFLPCDQNGQPVFATCRDGELWVSLLEKAWAKLHGTYARTEGGLPCFAVNHITGVPTESHQHDRVESKEDFFDMLQSADHRNFVMMVASTGEGENRNAEGVISGHAYSLISIHELNHRGKEIKLLKLRNPWGSGEWQGDWSDNSPLWTPQLKQKCGFVDGDDGIFFIELDDYLQHFSWTSICVEKDDDKYKHSQLYHSFGSLDESPMPQAFFSFILDEAVDFNEKAFAISVLQQGQRLLNYRQKDARQKFDPSKFNIVLMTANGEFVNARFGSHFTFSLLNQKITLNPGKYVFMVDPIWNSTTDNAEEYKEVLIDIYGPRAVDINPVSDAEGMQYLSNAFKHAAKTKNLDKQYYLADNEDYGRDVTRISDIKSLNCWYGFIHTQNDSPYAMTETLRLDLTGLEVAHPQPNSGTDFNFTIQPGEDHIVILRRTEAKCSYGLQYMTEPRPISDQEMLGAATDLPDSEANFFGDSKAFFKLYNSSNGSCFYFENREKRMTLNANFDLQMDNLQIEGSPPGATKFAVKIGPGQKSHTMLKPIQNGEATGIQMRFEHSFK